MQRYNVITEKNPREIVLLKGFPCAYGRCTFCDYTLDNSKCEKMMVELNHQVLKRVTGELGVLEVINSGSVFELPKATLLEIKELAQAKKLKRLYFEAHWMYRQRIKRLKAAFPCEVWMKIGVESFDPYFRKNVLGKIIEAEPAEIASYFESACIMVGIKGQTLEMIRNDVALLKKHFQRGTINVFTNNTTPIKRDEALVAAFFEEFYELKNDPLIEVLGERTDFGVGD